MGHTDFPLTSSADNSTLHIICMVLQFDNAWVCLFFLLLNTFWNVSVYRQHFSLWYNFCLETEATNFTRAIYSASILMSGAQSPVSQMLLACLFVCLHSDSPKTTLPPNPIARPHLAWATTAEFIAAFTQSGFCAQFKFHNETFKEHIWRSTGLSSVH